MLALAVILAILKVQAEISSAMSISIWIGKYILSKKNGTLLLYNGRRSYQLRHCMNMRGGGEQVDSTLYFLLGAFWKPLKKI